MVEAKGRRVRGRLYPWGIVEGNAGLSPAAPALWGRGHSAPITARTGDRQGRGRGPLIPLPSPAVENPSHCDFVKLRTMLVRTHMQDLKDVTRETHYENYRTQCIQSMTRMVVKERNRKYGPGLGWTGGLLSLGCPHPLQGRCRGVRAARGSVPGSPGGVLGSPSVVRSPSCALGLGVPGGDAPAVRGPCIPRGWVCLSYNTPAVRGSLGPRGGWGDALVARGTLHLPRAGTGLRDVFQQ